MHNTAYMQELADKIYKYDTEVKAMKFKYKSLFEEIRGVDAAVANKGIINRKHENGRQIERDSREQLCTFT